MNALAGSAIFAIVCFSVFVALKWFDKHLLFGFGLLLDVYVGIDDFVTSLPAVFNWTNFLGGKWNLEGKIFSLLLSVTVVSLLKIDREALGLKIQQDNAGRSFVAFFVLLCLSLSIGFVFKPDAPTFETIAFQLTMPGFAEEIAYRGIAPAILLGLIHRKPRFGGIPWVAVLITGITFGIWHGIGIKDGAPTFDAASAAVPLIGGIAYGWLRFVSGSLLLPILAHCLGNVLFYGHIVFR